ncbi:SpoIIE family protein phosphatase [Catenulispora sp. NF23]|uniref:SpoIIE family protein phosphatase n=1 Tax=Catenulispora pinistramenti TaxID=2705254 RepID=UPI001BACD9A7|nr:SpoIIE family protein phosphatase [Catenulispora pinistramenti]MBS2536553.1 SpoIIE family protein phosphatase [Catenulispora pinistramenti]
MDIDNGHPRGDSGGGHSDALLGTIASLNTGLLVDVLAEAPVGVGLLDTELRWLYANPAFLSTTGLEPARILGRPVAATPFAADLQTISRILAEGNPREAADPRDVPEPRDVPGPRAVADRADAADRGVVADAADPGDAAGQDDAEPGTATATGWQVRYRRLETEGRAAGVVVVVMGAATRQQRRLDQAGRRLALQQAAAERIGTTLDVDITCIELAELAVPALADLAIVEVMTHEIVDRAVDRGVDHGQGGRPEPPRMRRAALACPPELRRRLGALALPAASIRPGPDSAVALSLAEGEAVVANLVSDADLADLAQSPETLAAYRIADVDSLVAVPLNARGRLVGVLTLARVRGTFDGFTDDDKVLIQDLADRAAVSVENARQYADSQSVTLELQRALLVEPGRPHSNLEVAARYLPSGNRTLVGGDWYEIVRLPFGRTLLVMGDVMGHGVEAAVDMSIYRSAIRDAGGMDLPPHGILRHLDTLISQDDTARPATCLLGVADPNRDRWTFASAGHLPPALFAPGRPTELVTVPTGPPLGTGIGGYEQTIVNLRPDQILLMYTDGLVERRGEDIDVSLARLAALPLGATGGLEDLLDDALHLVAPPAIEDDIAILAARATPR